MGVNRDINLGTVVPIALFLVVQSATGIWWASYINAELRTIVQDVENQAAEDLRQWDRINSTEDIVQQAIALEQATATAITAVQNDITVLRDDIRINSSLLRELIREINRGSPN